VSHKDELGGRMKAYEAAFSPTLPRRSYAIIRVDGRAFHTLLKNENRPFDSVVTDAMGVVATDLCQEIGNAKFAYQQSDEVSILVTDFDSITTTPWFGGNVQKLASVTAAIATASFTDTWVNDYNVRVGQDLPTFDARVFVIPDPVEVANYFVWRQKDAIRNAVSQVAHAHFSNRELHGLNVSQQISKLFLNAGISFHSDFPARNRFGTVAYRTFVPRFDTELVPGPWQHAANVTPVRRWVTSEAPIFVADNYGFLADQIPEVPRLWAED
jgi:tRNA(His) guanylyltransferase